MTEIDKAHTRQTPKREVKREGDLVTRVIEYLQNLPSQQMPSSPAPEVWEKVEADLRHHFGGQEAYVGKKQPAAPQILRLFNGRNATEVARKLRVSRGYVYRVLKQPGKQSKSAA